MQQVGRASKPYFVPAFALWVVALRLSLMPTGRAMPLGGRLACPEVINGLPTGRRRGISPRDQP
jgi:hypothetical protein